MSPAEPTHFRGDPVHLFLETLIVRVAGVVRKLDQKLMTSYQLIPLPAGDLDRLLHRDLHRVVRRVSRVPSARLPSAEDPKLQSAPACDAPKDLGELLVVLEPQPI